MLRAGREGGKEGGEETVWAVRLPGSTRWAFMMVTTTLSMLDALICTCFSSVENSPASGARGGWGRKEEEEGGADEVLGDGEGVPVEGVEAGADGGLQVAELPAQQLLLRRRQAPNHALVVHQHHLERLHEPVVLVLLQRHVERVLGHREAHAVEVLGLPDDGLQLAAEVDHDHALVLAQDRRLELLHHHLLHLALPRLKQPVLELPHHPPHRHVVLGHELALLAGHHVGVGLEADDALLDAVEEGLGPRDGAGHRGLVLEGRGVRLVLLELALHQLHLLLVPPQNVRELVHHLPPTPRHLPPPTRSDPPTRGAGGAKRARAGWQGVGAAGR
eukprot:3816066-Rhodomonas_salina.1